MVNYYISPSEFGKAIERFQNIYDKAYFMLLREGATAEQILGLRAGDIDVSGRTIMIAHEAVTFSAEAVETAMAAARCSTYRRSMHLKETGYIEETVEGGDYVIKFCRPFDDSITDLIEEKHKRMAARITKSKFRSLRGIPGNFNESNVRKSGLIDMLLPYIGVTAEYIIETGEAREVLKGRLRTGEVDALLEKHKSEISRIAKRWGRQRNMVIKIVREFIEAL